MRFLDNLPFFPFFLAVAQKVAEAAGEEMLRNGVQKLLIELKRHRKLHHNLVDAVKKLEKRG